jgi:hypothetical protein
MEGSQHGLSDRGSVGGISPLRPGKQQHDAANGRVTHAWAPCPHRRNGARGRATGDWATAHYGRFLTMLSEYLAMRNEDPDFEPAYPVVAAGMRGVEGIEPDVYITDPTTGGFSYGLGPAAVGLQPNSPGRVGSRIRQALGHMFVAAKGQPGRRIPPGRCVPQ